MARSGLQIAPAGTFPPSLPFGSSVHISAWLFWKAICNAEFKYCAGDRSVTVVTISESQRRAGEAGSLWGCRVGGSLWRSGAAEGREPAGRSPKRRCFSSSSGLTARSAWSYPQGRVTRKLTVCLL